MSPPHLDPTRTALVLLDFQPVVVSAVNDVTGTLLSKAQLALSWARANELRVAHVRVAFTPADFAAIPEQNRTFWAYRDGKTMLVDGEPQNEFVDTMMPIAGEIVARKTRFGAFSTTRLKADLRDAGVDSLVLAGLTTSGAVLSTLRDAADQDFRLYALRDVMADIDPQVHRLLVDNVFPDHAEVITTDQLASIC